MSETKKTAEEVADQRRRWREATARYHKAHPERVRESAKKARLRYRRKHPEHRAAQKSVYRAVKRGTLIRPANCSLCGRRRRTEAHHHDYSKRHDVVWLCSPCHVSTHHGGSS